MKHSVFMTTAYGFAVLLISVIILGIIAPKKKKNNAEPKMNGVQRHAVCR